MHHDFSVALPETVDRDLRAHLIRSDGQEDLVFGLWSPSYGAQRTTALLHSVVMPRTGDRDVHGNVSFNQQYFERVSNIALHDGVGISFLHSHPCPGWQGMSPDDVIAEQRIAGAVAALTGLPLVGLTVGSDGTWSARFWDHERDRSYRKAWCSSVRTVGSQICAHFADHVLAPPALHDLFRRTVSVWGSDVHRDLTRLSIGIVGLGSVGALVAESLARMGFTRFVFIDHDYVQNHNLDRLVTACVTDVGRLKVAVAESRVRQVATAESISVQPVPFSIAEQDGYTAALDCDVIFSCVDRPRPRHILNHIAYAHLIPVIDGGIGPRFKNGQFSGVDWQVQTVGPGRPCLECLGAYNQADVSTDEAGKLDDPAYLDGLGTNHRFKRNENVFPFSANLASLEVMHLIALGTAVAGVEGFGVQRFRYIPGIIEQLPDRCCHEWCDRDRLIAQGDRHFTPAGRDLNAERIRLEHEGIPGELNEARRSC